MENNELMAWIRKEITSTRLLACEDVVAYEECLEPNPEMHFCEFTSHRTTRDRQYTYVDKPIYGTVLRTVVDEKRASAAADALVAFVLADEQRIGLAEELMGEYDLFVKYWERLCLHGKEKRTRDIALHRLGRAPWQLFMKKARKFLSHFKEPLQNVWKCFVAVCVYGTIIYVLWPKSRLGLWIGRIVKNLVAESRRIISG